MSKKRFNKKQKIFIAVGLGVVLIVIIVAVVVILLSHNQAQDVPEGLKYGETINCMPIRSGKREDLCRWARETSYPYVIY